MNIQATYINECTTDWLASDPIFYNELTAKVSSNINEVIDFNNLEFHPEGFNNYLDFGYSVFGQTPVKHVKFLCHSSSLSVQNGKVIVRQKEDPAEKFPYQRTSEEETLSLLRTSIQHWEKSFEGEIIIPTSGGYDSRILNEMIQDKDRIRSFTYGISNVQRESYEVVYAQKISELLGTRFEQIQIGSYHNFFNGWNDLFGVSTHAHGMYQMEFYDKIKRRVKEGSGLLSGIIGDAWAGSVSIAPITTANDVFKLGYSHGVHADSSRSLLKHENELLKNYFTQNKEKLEDPRFRIIESMRFKIILLCYLLRVPARLGFKPWSPFLEQEIALSMLNLPENRRSGRVWQTEYFRKKGLDVESLYLNHTKKNTLDRKAMYHVPLQPLKAELLREVVQPTYIEWINKHILPTHNLRDFMDTLIYYPRIGGLLKKMGVRDERMAAYNAYLTLQPIETLLIRRNNA